LGGATIPIHNFSTGEVIQAPLFVATLGVSSYTHAEAARNQQVDSWIQVNMHALEFYGGVPQLSIPDNTKTGVTKACRYDPDLNPTYQEFAMHYGMGVLPTRPYKPRDKAKVEERYQARSVILTSQMPVARWHEQIGDPTVADGILDRLVHNAHRIEMRGDSMRKNRGKTGV